MNAAPSKALVTGITRTHYAQLDGLRGLAILLVVCYHFFLPHQDFHGGNAGVFLQVARAGWMGVDLFFVLSGFLITGILIETRTEAHYFRNFLGRRFLRIWPLYYLNLLLLLVVLPLVMPSIPPQVQGMQDKQAWFWLYGANWLFAREGGFGVTSGGYLWSLAVEEQFYVVWPLVVFWLSDRALLRTSLALLGLSFCLRIALVNTGVSTGALYTMTFTHLDGLALGSCLAIFARSPAWSERVSRAAPLAALGAMVALVAIWLADGDLFYWSKAMATYGYTVIAVLAGALLVGVMHAKRETLRSRFFSNRFMTLCGKYSYALYLIHVPVAGLMYPATMRLLDRIAGSLPYDVKFSVFFLLAFLVSIGLSMVSWFAFEKPILALKRHFSYSEAGGAAKSASGEGIRNAGREGPAREAP